MVIARIAHSQYFGKMKLEEHYNKLYTQAIQKIESDEYETDGLIGSPMDDRFGLTLLIRPSDEVKKQIQAFLKEVRTIEPDQYFYPDSDLHVTVMSIISCQGGFDLSQIDRGAYIEIIKDSLPKDMALDIKFEGVTASPSCVMVRGFASENLNETRNKLRVNFRNSALVQSIDKRYSIRTAHSTVIRFKSKLKEKNDFLNILKDYEQFSFGTFSPTSMELVFNDWYQSTEKTKLLHRFKL